MNIRIIFFLFLTLPAGAQGRSQEGSPDQLPTITVTAETDILEASIFPDRKQDDLPTSSRLIKKTDLQKHRVQRLSEVTTLEASTTNSYNAVGYWDYLSVRGYVLDNRGSYLREGLPINAETAIPLDNKARIEILKGLSGMQVGASSPGGMVNYVVQRPSLKNAGDPANELTTSLSNKGNFLLAGNAGGQFNFAYENLRPSVEHANGSRYLIGLAEEWRLSENILLEIEAEHSRKSQPSQAGMSLLGNTLPPVSNPNFNLNNQPWTEPVAFEGLTGTVRLTQSLTPRWKWSLIGGIQDLTTDDRLAYPYGCTAENNFDRYCSNGSFDVYDFRSENERRTMTAVKLSTQVSLDFGTAVHSFNVGVLQSQSRERFQKQAYNYVGTGNIQGSTALPADSRRTDESTNRDSLTTEVFIYDAVQWGRWSAWLGLRQSDIDRYSIRTDGSRAAKYRENFTVPWTALSYNFESFMTYASYGDGVETYVTPNRSGYARPGTFVPVALSQQYEVGIKGDKYLNWSAAIFEIHRPVVTDQSPLYQLDGEARHRGLELNLARNLDRWNGGVSLMVLEATRENSTLTPALNGKRPVNVPKNTFRAFAEYQALQNISVLGRVSREDDRAVTSDNSITIPSWQTYDLGTTYTLKNTNSKTSIGFLIENLTDEKYWKESPTQYAHIYLYPGTERTFSLTVQHSF